MQELKKLTLLHLLRYSAEKFSERPSISFIDSQPLTYREFKNKIESVSAFLKSEGIISGDKVAILSENQPNWAIAYFAITSMGAIAVPIMTEFSVAEVHHVLRHSESKAIFVSAKQFNKIEDFKEGNIQLQILLDDFSIIPFHTKNDLLKEIISSGKKELAKIKEAALKLVGIFPDEVEEENPALILYTSGTTGHSKGVVLTHKNVVSNAIDTLKIVDVKPEDRLLSILPLFHTIESTLGLVTPVLAGASITYLNKPPTAAVLLPALSKIKPTVILAVPLIIEKIYKLKVLPEINKKIIVRSLYKIPYIRKKLNKIAGKKLKHTFGGELKMLCLGGAPLSADVELFLKEAEFPYAVGYGLTETSPLVTGTNPKEVRFRSAGKPLPTVRVKIDNPDPITGEGEILIKGPNVMKGYYKDPERTKNTFTEDGWFKSGDLGLIDKDGYLFIKGRLKNVIIGSNGKNIYPEEIESIINESKYVLESLVHERNGQLIARVYLNYDEIDNEFKIQKLNESSAREIINKILSDLLNQVNERVNTFSRLTKVIEQREPFEKTPTQKIKRYLYVE
ncbi:MAG: AMP-binding protein [Melioribacter sp.]|uniref:AMP-binding protein n=1 Tax=Rosettibacter primus TaxID=3111523 RepID=UPI00247DE78E|nr:AMP-binding protein [Melioribacter sp.]